MNTFALQSNKVLFFYTLVDEIREKKILEQYQSITNTNEKTKISSYIFEKDQHNCLVTRGLVRFVLSACTGLPAGSLDFIENKYGKPALKPGLTTLPLRFNISHSSGMTACAVTLNHDIGIDIEDFHRSIELNIANRFFAQAEAEYIKNLPDKNRQEGFFDLWILKEAYIKARGMGLSISLESFRFEINKNIRIHFDEIDDSPDHWQFFRFSPVNDYKAAIAINSPTSNSIELQIYKCIPFHEVKQQHSITIYK